MMITTACGRDEAGRLARMLVEQKLAACVQLLPIDSVYRWEGAVRQEAEVLLLIKTRSALAQAVISAIKAAHSYDTPEIIALPIEAGLGDYLAWIDQATG